MQWEGWTTGEMVVVSFALSQTFTHFKEGRTFHFLVLGLLLP